MHVVLFLHIPFSIISVFLFHDSEILQLAPTHYFFSFVSTYILLPRAGTPVLVFL